MLIVIRKFEEKDNRGLIFWQCIMNIEGFGELFVNI